MPTMPSFSVSDLKSRAVKAKDASVYKISNTRDKFTSTSSKKYEWDPNQKPPPPPPPQRSTSSVVTHARTQSNMSNSSRTSSPISPPPSRTLHSGPASTLPGPPPIKRDTRPDHTPLHTPSPPPLPVHSAPGHTHTRGDPEHIDWINLSPEDKQALFAWLDEFFERFLNIKIPSRKIEPTIQRTSRPVTPPRPVSTPGSIRILIDLTNV
ncbi:hypothetical protein PHLCEN_2v11101 [Hermanssonia centrifuga]|uniref:Uncharacterized protein n=1 Tax=Hermanssonia centrifuga TaxID=98765 RepID=A0A2R6NKV1_9APHY|nr:hypothetical protein PHLCEN_2v11101 [Hermanssonia centrifuga]